MTLSIQRSIVILTRQLAKRWLTGTVFLVSLTAAAAAHREPQNNRNTAADRPNILLIVADDLGYGDPGFQGGKDIPTPHLDALAASGVRFTNGYVTCAVCSPTRAGLATGRYQQRFGHEFNPGQAQTGGDVTIGLPLSEKTIASALHDAGYLTANVGKWHLGAADGYRPQQRGFDEFYGFLGGAHPYVPGGENAADNQPAKGNKRRANAAAAKGADPNAGGAAQPIYRGDKPTQTPLHLTQAFGDEAAAFITRHKDNHEKPYFLYLAFNAVHNPLQPDAEHLARFASIEDPKRRAYAALLSGLDDAVGNVLKTLRETGQESNTIVFFISDNGGPQQGNGSNNKPLSGDKGSVWEGGIRVPFVVSWKGKLPAGIVYEQPVISLDITATAAALGSAKLGGEGRPVDGVNLLPYLTNEIKTPPHDSLYWRFGAQHAIRRGNFKLLQIGDEEPRLYDLAADTGEKNNLAASQPDTVRELNGLYDAWNKQLAEPLWKKNLGAGQKRTARRVDQRSASTP